MATKGPKAEDINDVNCTDVPMTSKTDEPKQSQSRSSEDKGNDTSIAMTSSTASTYGENDIPKTSLLDNSGTSSHRLNESVLREAKAKIVQAEEDRRKSRLPRRLIPLVEMCLPPNYRLSQFEKDAGKTYQKVFGSCMSSDCLCNINDGEESRDADRKDEDGELFDKTIV